MADRNEFYVHLGKSAGSAEQAAAIRRELQARLAGSAYANAEAQNDLFCRNAEAAGAVVLRCRSLDEAAAAVAEHLQDAARVVIASDPILENSSLVRTLRARSPEMDIVRSASLPSGEEGKHIQAASDAGVNVAVAGIADAGAVIISSSEYETRSLSLLSAQHVALLPAVRILPSLYQAADLLRDLIGGRGRSAVTLVGGPSKTADIEKVLVTGVHGPGVLTIVLIEGGE